MSDQTVKEDVALAENSICNTTTSKNGNEDAALVQGSDEWHRARLGSLGASRIHEAIARTKKGWGASRKNLMADLIVERMTGVTAEHYLNAAMQHGIDTEPQARGAYCFFRDAEVKEVGLVRHPTISRSHASPDGYVGDMGLVEIKCPSSATHIDTLLTKTIPGRYITQMQWQMACDSRAWCDYVSFDPRMPESLKMFAQRVERNDKRIAELEDLVLAFLAEIDDMESRLRELGNEEIAV